MTYRQRRKVKTFIIESMAIFAVFALFYVLWSITP